MIKSQSAVSVVLGRSFIYKLVSLITSANFTLDTRNPNNPLFATREISENNEEVAIEISMHPGVTGEQSVIIAESKDYERLPDEKNPDSGLSVEDFLSKHIRKKSPEGNYLYRCTLMMANLLIAMDYVPDIANICSKTPLDPDVKIREAHSLSFYKKDEQEERLIVMSIVDQW